MHRLTSPDLDFLKNYLEGGWDSSIIALRDSGVPTNLEGDDGDTSSGAGATGPAGGGDGDATGTTGSAGASGDDGDTDGDTEFVRIPKAEYDAARTAARQQSERAKKAEREAKAQKEREAAEKGQFKELADGYKGERDDALRERDDARRDYQDLTRRIEVEKVAKRLDFVDTEDAWIHAQRLNMADEAWSDPAQVEKALKRILREKPHLQGKGRVTGASRKGGGTTLTREEVSRMTEDEINSRWTEVQAALAAG